MLPCVIFSFMENLSLSTFAKEDRPLGAARTDTPGEQTSALSRWPCSNVRGSRQNLPALHHAHKTQSKADIGRCGLPSGGNKLQT